MNFNHAVDVIYDFQSQVLCVQRRRDLSQVFISGLDKSQMGNVVLEAISPTKVFKFDWQPMLAHYDFFRPGMGVVVIYKKDGDFCLTSLAKDWERAPTFAISQQCKRDELGDAILALLKPSGDG